MDGINYHRRCMDTMGYMVNYRCHGNNSGVSDRDGLVGCDGGLDLRESPGVVSLGHAGVGGSKGLGLDKGPLLAVGGGDGLVAGLAPTTAWPWWPRWLWWPRWPWWPRPSAMAAARTAAKQRKT